MQQPTFNNFSLCIENSIATITLEQTKTLNALSSELLEELDAVFTYLTNEEPASSLRCIIITGREKAFVAGADIAEMAPFDQTQAIAFSRKGADLFRKIETHPLPIIAAINGFCLGGGCELAMACDIRIASSKAKFGQPEVNLGLIPGFSGTWRMPRLIGIAKAKELIYTGRIISAQEALSIGLVNMVVEENELLQQATSISLEIAQRSPQAVKTAKEAINRGVDMITERAIELEANLFGKCFSSKDKTEGIKAFLEKRKPNFT